MRKHHGKLTDARHGHSHVTGRSYQGPPAPTTRGQQLAVEAAEAKRERRAAKARKMAQR